MPRHSSATLVLVVALWLPAVAAAQVLERPPRSTGGLFGGRRPVDPNQTRQELVLTLNLLGGYDDNLTPSGEGVSTNPFAPRQSGYTGVGAVGLQYFRGRAIRSLEGTGRAYVNSYSGLNLAPLVGGDGSVNAISSLGRRTTVTAALSAQSRPTFALGAFDPIADVVEAGVVPETEPTFGFAEMRSVSGDATATLGLEWTRRQRTTFGYGFSRQSFTDDLGFDSKSHVASLAHSWDVRRNSGIRLSYRYTDQAMEDLARGTRPMQSHAADAGLEWRRAFSPTRRVALGAGAGATHVRTVSILAERRLEYVAPSGFGIARLDLARTWSLSADFRRASTVLDGLTHQAFMTDAASIRTGGNIGERVQTSVSASYSRGGAREVERGRYESLTGTAQVQLGVASCCSLVATYSYYEHRLRDIAALPEGFPLRFERNSVRLGFTISLPLYGTFTAGRRRSGGGD